MTTAPVLHARDVEVVRDGSAILSDVSLTVRAGEHWALLGPNGAGKTTLLALLGALAHPTRGAVEVLGHRLGRVDMRQLRSCVGHVNPRHDLRSALKVHDVVLTGVTNSLERVPDGLRPPSRPPWPTASSTCLASVAAARHGGRPCPRASRAVR
ncbi:hypothetical protein SHKM778_46640 [Streptomyces sp. KM77-8]|uniref:ABC transporter domain-containing protein n=1 Tax=Streptomyces haneummycinicus TaxID=3074435 RepID=A0AAT9HLR8_9ACTN